MNRAQFAKVTALVFGLKVDTALKNSSFTDVSVDTSGFGYALPYIEALKREGIIDGVGEGRFDPAGKVTKEQLAKILVLGLGMSDAARESEGVVDSTVSDWARGYVDIASKLNLISSDSEGSFGGNISADREDLVIGAFESAKTFETSQPLEASGAHFESGNILHLNLTAKIDLASIDLSKFKINGIPLDPKLDSFELSADLKTITIKLHKALPFEPGNMPLIDISDHLATLYGNTVENEAGNPISVTLDESIKPTPALTPAPTPLSLIHI